MPGRRGKEGEDRRKKEKGKSEERALMAGMTPNHQIAKSPRESEKVRSRRASPGGGDLKAYQYI